MSLEHGPVSRLRTASTGKTALGRGPMRKLTVVTSRSPARNRAAAHYMALVAAAVSGCLSLPRVIPQPASRTTVRTKATWTNQLTADHAYARLPRAQIGAPYRAKRAGFPAGVGTGVEPATASSLDWCSAIELTVTTSPSSESMYGTHLADSSWRARAPLARRHRNLA